MRRARYHAALLVLFHYLHQEDVDMSVDPTSDQPLHVAKDPFASDQGLPTVLFSRARHRDRFYPRAGVDGSRETLAQSVGLSAQRWIQGVVFDTRVFGAFDPRRRETCFALLGPLMGFRLAVILEAL